MTKTLWWIIVSLLAVLIGFYPVIYLVSDKNFGLLSSKTSETLNDLFWNLAFYAHIFLGGLALLTGWVQFNGKWRLNHLNFHRWMGKIYVLAVLLSSIAGFYLAFFATGGIVASLGFLCLAIIWFYTTLASWRHIMNKRVLEHRKMMVYSYAACFAAVTLRIWLPFLMFSFGNFLTAYLIVA